MIGMKMGMRMTMTMVDNAPRGVQLDEVAPEGRQWGCRVLPVATGTPCGQVSNAGRQHLAVRHAPAG